jgi:anti-sigma regulatory factor (Ser/Thr protein kinase)
MNDVWLIEVAAPFLPVAEEVDLAVAHALAECPRGVVIELVVPPAPTAQDQLDLLASSGRHPWAWPATPVAVACKNPETQVNLQQHRYGKHLMICSSTLQGWAQIMNTEPALTERLELLPNAHAARAARQFVARTCSDWNLGSRRDDAVAIASELTTNAVQHAGTDLDVLLALAGESLRIAVRDRTRTPPREQTPAPGHLRGLGLPLVRTLSDLTGTLPTRDGGKMVWAILRPH